MMRIANLFITVGIATLGIAGCGHELTSNAKLAAAADHDLVERHDALNVISDALCHRQADLGKVGSSSDAKYSDIEDCKAHERDRWSSVWSEDKCGTGHGLYAGKVRECRDRAKTWETTGNVLDFGGLVTECSASSVCRS